MNSRLGDRYILRPDVRVRVCFFDARDGALISADGQTISLPAPVVVDATTLKGDGWTATVGPGWTVQPGPQPGSFRVVRQ